jgi:hypothetical protein
MYKLMVSWDCGISYECEKKSDNINDFKERTIELDNQMLRWSIEDNKNNLVGIPCKIHQEIIQTLSMMQNRNK